MNWDMISAVGQMLGAVGVIISIVYLAAQIRNQNKESRKSACSDECFNDALERFEQNACRESRNGRALAACSAIIRPIGRRIEAKVWCTPRAFDANFRQSLS